FLPFNIDDFAAAHILNFDVIVSSGLFFYGYWLSFLIAALLLSRAVGATILLRGTRFKAHISGIGMLGLGFIHIYFCPLFRSLLHAFLIGLHFGDGFPNKRYSFLVDLVQQLFKHLKSFAFVFQQRIFLSKSPKADPFFNGVQLTKVVHPFVIDNR